MYDFLLQLFFISSLAAVIYLMGRALPRVSEDENQTNVLVYLESFVKKLPLSKIDHSISVYIEKTLRKVRVVVLRLDNMIHDYISKKNNGD